MENESKTMSIAALVLGIIAIVLSSKHILLGIIIGAVGIYIGTKARREENSQSLAMAGFVCAIIAVVISALKFVLLIAGVALLSVGLVL